MRRINMMDAKPGRKGILRQLESPPIENKAPRTVNTPYWRQLLVE